MSNENSKLGLWGLIALVFGPMIGGGIYNIAQNMASGAAMGAVSLAWIITAIGILSLVATFKVLSDRRPDLNAGIYEYAQEGYGRYIGFNMAWGYWLCTAFGNVAYMVMLNDTLGAFFPVFLDHGWPTIVFGTILIWSMFYLVSRGIRSASIINLVITTLKFAALGLVAIVLIIYFKFDLFTSDIWGNVKEIGSVGSQIQSTMLVTLWCFVGIEGAVMMSARARRPSDVGKAGVIGFLCAWLLYVLISLLCFGVMSQTQLAHLPDPSIAYVLKYVCGDWAYYFILCAILISLFGGWIAWTLICAQVPYEAAKVKIFPRQLLRLNKHEVPTRGLLLSSVIMQIFIILVITADEVYMAALEITSTMMLPAYLFTGLFLLKACYMPNRFLPHSSVKKLREWKIIAIACVTYCLWTLYAGGLEMLLVASLFYVAGTWLFVKARRQNAIDQPIFTKGEKIIFGLLCCLAVISLVVIISKGSI